ncbi:hypothetical protein ACSFA7_30915 [Variovorax sp. LT1R20]|uniref:hypothetical protein n=1 Tax=Variovorax sp. LT1R20 TaxID=3443729 RepID=UPI003F45B111
MSRTAGLTGENQGMFLPPPQGTERVQLLAARLGCVVGELDEADGRKKPALLGSLSGFAKVLEEFGARWDQADRVYVFATWPMLEAALQHMADGRGQSRVE